MCSRCGDRFEVPQSNLDKFPGWSPRTCLECRPAAKAARAEKGRGSFGGPYGARRGAAPVAAGLSFEGTLEEALAAVVAKYTSGPQAGVFTDGSCSGNPGPGGWGVVRVAEGAVVTQLHGADPATTNNRMELLAMITGLELLEPGADADIYSDSQLVVNTLTKWAAGWEKLGWRRREGEVKNLDLVQRAYALAQERPGVRINWIKAHDGSRWNEYADTLSTAYMRDKA